MVNNVSIKNFKSVKELEFPCKKVNVFIGEPNGGKSNLLEALALFSDGIQQCRTANQIIRYRFIADLFYDQSIDQPATVRIDNFACALKGNSAECRVLVTRGGTTFSEYRFLANGESMYDSRSESKCKYYQFRTTPGGGGQVYGALTAPYGDNLPALLSSNPQLRAVVKALFAERGFKLQIISGQQLEVVLSKEVSEVLYSYPFPTISETWQRIIFLLAALETNQNSVLIFDEPEANTFPFYTKHFAERIGLDQTNQFFLTTHNPYLLKSLIEKTPIKDLAVSIAYMRDYQTRLRQFTDEELGAMLEAETGSWTEDVFFNLRKYTGE